MVRYGIPWYYMDWTPPVTLIQEEGVWRTDNTPDTQESVFNESNCQEMTRPRTRSLFL